MNPKLVKQQNIDGSYNVVVKQHGKSDRILMERVSKEQAEEYIRKVRF